MTGQDLSTYVGATYSTAEATFADAKWAEADALVSAYVGSTDEEDNPHGVPDPVLKQATLEVGSKLWHRRGAAGAEGQFDTLDAAPVLPARDPMVTVYATLNRFLPGGIA